MSNTILVTGPDLDPAAAALIRDRGFNAVHMPPYATGDQVAEFLRETGAIGIVSRMGRIDAAAMDAAPGLRVISKHGVGVDNIDLAAAGERGIPVLVATGANAVSVAEHTIALLLAVVKRIVPLDAGLRAGKWEKPGFLGRELAGSRIGLLGIGAIAQATARIAHSFGLEVLAHDPYAVPEAFTEAGARRCETLEEMAEQSDILSLHCPLTDTTREVVNADLIARMPQGSFVVNTARGGLIDEAALVSAIRSGHLAGAGLDTFAIEPPTADHPYLSEERIVVTPHIGGVTREAGARVGVDAVRGIFDLLDGKQIPPARIANKSFLTQSGATAATAGE